MCLANGVAAGVTASAARRATTMPKNGYDFSVAIDRIPGAPVFLDDVHFSPVERACPTGLVKTAGVRVTEEEGHGRWFARGARWIPHRTKPVMKVIPVESTMTSITELN